MFMWSQQLYVQPLAFTILNWAENEKKNFTLVQDCEHI
jgi:hypothetical protein